MSQRPLKGPSELTNFAELSSLERNKVIKASLIRPMNLLIIVLGVFASLLSWWFLPVTAVTYALLVYLASRDPFFITKTVGTPERSIETKSGLPDIPPERRVRWLSRGETREKIEKSLEIYRDIVSEIESSDDVTSAVLGDAVPKLHSAADRLVDIAHNKEKAVLAIQKTTQTGTSNDTSAENSAIIGDLEAEVRRIDFEIEETFQRLVNLRGNIARTAVSDNAAGRATAAELNRSLDSVNLRLEALNETTKPE